MQDVELELREAKTTHDTLSGYRQETHLPVCPHCDGLIPGDPDQVISIVEQRIDELEQQLESLQRKKKKVEEYMPEDPS